jgi:hypothetical protein
MLRLEIEAYLIAASRQAGGLAMTPAAVTTTAANIDRACIAMLWIGDSRKGLGGREETVSNRIKEG